MGATRWEGVGLARCRKALAGDYATLQGCGPVILFVNPLRGYRHMLPCIAQDTKGFMAL